MDIKKVSIRKCGLKDLETVIELRLEFLKEAGHVKAGEDIVCPYGKIREFMVTHINKDLHLWLADIGNEAVATGAVCIWEKLPHNFGESSSSRIGYILNMYTRPENRKKGIASTILQEIIQFLKAEGILRVILHAMEDGKGIYKKCGFSSNEHLMEMKISNT